MVATKKRLLKSMTSNKRNDGRTNVPKFGNRNGKKIKNGKHVIIENAVHDLYMQSPLIGDLVWDLFMGKEPNSKRMVIEPTIFE